MEGVVMSETRLLERVSAADHYSLLYDDFGWPGDIGVLAVAAGARLLDGDGRVRIDAVRRRVESRLHLVPRFRQVLYRPSFGLGWPVWVGAQGFDVAGHVGVFPLPPSAGEAELLAACEQLRRRRLDPARPLWQLWLLPGLSGQRVGLFVRVHHAIADGVAGVAALGALLDVAADATTPAAPPWTPAPVPAAGELFRDNLRRRLQGLDRTASRLAHPVSTLGQLRADWPAWREEFAEQRAPRTSLNRPAGSHRRLALVRSRLEAARRIAHAHGAKVNDVVLTAVAGGLRELLRSRGENVDGLVLRAMVPVSLHHEQPGQARGNLAGIIMVPLPAGEPDPARLLPLIAAETAERKAKAHPQAMGTGIFRFRAAQRAALRLANRQRRFTLLVTNVPGPPVPLYLAGAPLVEAFPLVPLVGNETLSVAVLSYAGQLNLTAVADADTCPDVNVFAHGVRTTLDKLAQPAVTAAS
jgi:diacylglycerol O-acyltransferase / wax synthase